MDNIENNFLGDDNKLFNDYFNSSDKGTISNNNINSTNFNNDINIDDLNINEEDELKNFAESLNRGEHSKDASNFVFSQNIISSYDTKSNKNNNNLLDNYITRLRNFGFPEIGTITLSEDPKEQEKTFKFFDYIILKKANNLDDYQKYKRSNDLLQKKCEDLEIQINKYKKEMNNLRNELKTYSKEKNDYQFKSNKQKDYYEKLMNKTKKENIYLNNKINKILLEKRNIEEKYQTLSEMLNKHDLNKTKIINTIEISDYIQKNNIAKMINKVKGAEKLAATLKGGYNDSLRELLFEISALKNFIYDYHVEVASLLDNYEELDKEMLNMSFLDTVNNIKEIFNINMGLLKKKFGFLDNEDFHFKNLDKCLNDEKINS
jgi:uncharacterized coiled-coil DUF342 family protein